MDERKRAGGEEHIMVPRGDVALSTHQICKTFDIGFLGGVRGLGGWVAKHIDIKGISQRIDAVRSVSLSVYRGEIYGFLGPNGAGKTTTIKMLMGLIHPTSGSGILLGSPLGHRAARRQLGFLPEHPYFYEYLRPAEFLDFYARLFSINYRERKRRVDAMIDRVGLGYARDRPIRKFSKGMVQRIGIAQALINDPDLIVLDEPMSGLDPIGRKDVRDLIFELKAQGKTVFFSSHILQDVEMLVDRVGIMVKGQLRREGRLHDLLQAPSERVDVAVEGIDDALAAALTEVAATTHRVGRGFDFGLDANTDTDGFIRRVLDCGGHIIRVSSHRQSLEDLFVAQAKQGS